MQTLGTSKKQLLSPRDAVAEYPILNERCLSNDRWAKRGIPYFKFRRKVFYRREDIERYLFANPVKTIDSIRAEG